MEVKHDTFSIIITSPWYEEVNELILKRFNYGLCGYINSFLLYRLASKVLKTDEYLKVPQKDFGNGLSK